NSCRNAWSSRSHSSFQGCLAVAGRIFQATGTAQPRYKRLTSKVVNRCPSVVASKARATCRLGQSAKTHRNSGAKQVDTSRSRRCLPVLASASQHHSRRRCLTVSSFCPRRSASWRATAVTEQECARIMPKLKKARPRTWARERLGKALVSVASQAYSWGRRDMVILPDAEPRQIRLSIGGKPVSPFD